MFETIILITLLGFFITWVIHTIIKDEKEERRWAKKINNLLDAYISPIEKPNETVSCETCKCLIKKEDAYRVRVYRASLIIPSEKIYYCLAHRKPYNKKFIASHYNDKAPYKYCAELEVTEDGTPIGYKLALLKPNKK